MPTQEQLPKIIRFLVICIIIYALSFFVYILFDTQIIRDIALGISITVFLGICGLLGGLIHTVLEELDKIQRGK